MSTANKSFTDLWYERARLQQAAHSSGWDVQLNAMASLPNPITFYVFEPLISGFKGIAVADRGEVTKARTLRLSDKNPAEFEEYLAHCTESFFATNNPQQEDLLVLMDAHINNFARTQTADAAIKADMRGMGAIIYRDIPGKSFFSRPIAFGHRGGENMIMSPEDIMGFFVQYMIVDHQNHPAFFGNQSLDSVLAKYI